MTAAAVVVAGAWGYVAGAYAVVFGVLVAYVTFVILRGRKVGRQVPPEERRWMS